MTHNDDRSAAERAKLRRRRWPAWILVPAIAGAAIGAVVASRVTPLYKSETLILVVPSRVSESYVRPTDSSKISDRLQSISQQILSRTRLERMIQEFDLYSEERRSGRKLDEVTDMMRKNIEVHIDQSDAFSIGFIGTQPRAVMRVAERLASLLIEANMRDREALAEGTTQFLLAALENVRTRLVTKNSQLRALTRPGAPTPEAEVLAIEYDVLQTTFKDLLAKIEESHVARDLERLQIGEQFKLLDPAVLPERPIAPDWRAYVGIGAGAGVATGLLILLSLGTTTSFPTRRETPTES